MADDSPQVLPGVPKPPRIGKDLLNEETFIEQFDGLFNGFKIVINTLEDNRANRNLLVDVKGLQAQGKIQAHETYIAQRVIDKNIAREMPPHIAYLTQSRRLAIFKPNDTRIQIQTDTLETEFMRMLTYPNWIEDYTRLVDGAKLHGFDFVAVSYDPTFPGHVSVTHVGAPNLIFDTRVKCIQQSPIVAWTFEITTVDLYEFAKDYGFDPEVVAELNAKLEENTQNYSQSYYEANRIYRTFFKQDGKVYDSWYSKELKKYLKKPGIFFNGRAEQYEEQVPVPPGAVMMAPEVVMKWRPLAETDYPFYGYYNRITENSRITDTMGKADMDFYIQEASCSLWSSFVNSCKQSAQTMWAPKTPNPDVGIAPKQLSMVIENGKMWNMPMESFHVPWPDSMLPKSLEMLSQQNAEDSGQVAYAVNNRKDTRKTAAEIDAATEQQTVMSSVTVTLFSTSLRCIFEACWEIIKSEALQGKIDFAGNNPELLSISYTIIPAGSIDYVERQEMIASMQTDLPLIGPTAAGPQFLKEYMKAKYPQIADGLISALDAGQQANDQKVQALTSLLAAAVIDKNTGQLEAEWLPHQQELAALGVKVGAAQQPQQEAPTEQPV